jgi:hypothetical protein
MRVCVCVCVVLVLAWCVYKSFVYHVVATMCVSCVLRTEACEYRTNMRVCMCVRVGNCVRGKYTKMMCVYVCPQQSL